MLNCIETPRNKTEQESLPDLQAGDSVKYFFSVLLANLASGQSNALTGNKTNWNNNTNY